MATTQKPIEMFHHSLALSRWALRIFRGQSVETLGKSLNRREYEGVNEESGHTRFYDLLISNLLFDPDYLSSESLAAYDLRIVGYWARITKDSARRDATGNPIRMKYYQYLTLLVTEVYLDCYFNRRTQLLAELNEEIAVVNHALPAKARLHPSVAENLSKVAFWEATGCGKTLLMHVNILQYKWYAQQAGKAPARVILLSPNEGLSGQHLKELRCSGIKATPLVDDLLKDDAEAIGVIDSNKLSVDGSKGMPAEGFEGQNLVLVDEGHHGSSREAGAHRKVRDLLCRDGFSFEYSATFGQAVSNGNRSDFTLWDLYARNILFDYSYRYFFEDGYGKEALILNLDTRLDDPQERRFQYLVGNLLAYYQQHAVYASEKETMLEFGIAKPLCLFVGNTVNAPRRTRTGKVECDETASDVLDVIRFLADVLNRRPDVEKLIEQFVRDEPVVEVGDKNPFAGMFVPLSGRSATDIYQDMLQKVFHADGVQRLHVKLLRKCNEIALSVGAGTAFGVVNIGDPAAFVGAANGATRYLVDPADEFETKGLFASINETDSPITVLVGARKFMEGWSSWRVSAMGLLSVGQNEGTQIIQLFGRGVRLRGKDFSLKRSGKDCPKKSFLRKLETLLIFGVRANYMTRFREYLENEGAHLPESVLTLDFKVQKKPVPKGLRILRVAEGYGLKQESGFQAKCSVTLFRISDEDRKRIKKPVVMLEDYSRLQALRCSDDGGKLVEKKARTPVRLDVRAFPFFDYDRIYLAMLEHKARKGYRNLVVSKSELRRIADDMIKGEDDAHDWYCLYSRKCDVTFDSFSKLSGIETLFKRLVCGYMDAFYATFQRLYESQHMETVLLTEEILDGAGNFQWPDAYHFEFEDGADAAHWKDRLEKLQEIIMDGDMPKQCKKWSHEGSRDFVALAFDQTLYSPLFYSEEGVRLPFTMRPLSFDAPSEKTFLEDLICYYEDSSNAAFFEGLDVYLMRNASNRAKGIGFAQAGNFYPDFLLWMINKKTKQEYLGFIDPKGLRNVPYESPKLNFSVEVKELQKIVNARPGAKLILNSVILSSTPYSELASLFPTHTKEDYEGKNVFFLDEGCRVGAPSEARGKYLSKMFKALMKE